GAHRWLHGSKRRNRHDGRRARLVGAERQQPWGSRGRLASRFLRDVRPKGSVSGHLSPVSFPDILRACSWPATWEAWGAIPTAYEMVSRGKRMVTALIRKLTADR